MGIETANGANWSFDEGAFSFFDVRGYVDGKDWVVPSGFGLVAIDPSPVSSEILAMIEKSGNANVAYVVVHPQIALLLALEGIITVEALRDATETEGRIACVAMLGGAQRRIIVAEDYEPSIAVYGADDEII